MPIPDYKISGLDRIQNLEQHALVAGDIAAVYDRYPVATRWTNTLVGSVGSLVGATTRAAHVVRTQCAGLRFVYGNQFSTEALILSTVLVKAGLESPSPVAILSAALSTGGAITSIPVSVTGAAIASGTVVTVVSGTHTQTWTLSGIANAGATTLSVTSQTPNFAYPIASTITANVVYPMTFNGAQYGRLEQYGTIMTDPVPIEVAAGTTVYSRSYLQVPFVSGNAGYVVLAAGTTIGDTVVTTTLRPDGPMPQTCLLDSGGNVETVTVYSWTGTSNPYTLNLTTATTKNHSSGVAIGQPGYGNLLTFTDNGDAYHLNGDYSYVQTAFTAGEGNALTATTLTAACTAGDTLIKVVGPLAGDTLTLDSSGSGVQETVTVKTWVGTANPYTVYLTAPIVNSHLISAPVTATVSTGAGLSPLAIVADRLTGTRVKTVIIVGDSIAAGTGYSKRGAGSPVSFATIPLDAAGIPYLNIAKSGEAAYQFAVDSVSQLRRRMLTLADWALYQYGVNDIYGGVTLLTAQTNAMKIWADLKQRGLKIAATTIQPRTTSSDGWLTVANQTISNAGTSNVVRLAYNNWLRAWLTNGLAATYLDAVFEVANTIEVNAAGTLTQDGSYWLAGAAGPYTADGNHPSTVGHILMATAVSAATFV